MAGEIDATVLMGELGKVYAAMNELQKDLIQRVGNLEIQLTSVGAKLDMMPRHPPSPCDVVKDHEKRIGVLEARLAVLEASVHDHHRIAETDQNIKKDAGWKGIASVISAIIIAALSAWVTHAVTVHGK